jgi:hypothetical protein
MDKLTLAELHKKLSNLEFFTVMNIRAEKEPKNAEKCILETQMLIERAVARL